MTKDWTKRHRIWLDKFPQRKDAPPGGWAKYLGAKWLPKAEWFPRYNLYLKSHAWTARRVGALRRAGHKCQLCTAIDRLHVHHVTYDRVGTERIQDLRVLCKDCHKRLHDNGEVYIPLDYATREELRRRYELLKRKRENPPKPKTRRRPAPETPSLKDRFPAPATPHPEPAP